jgi:uncharacterized protein (TIGR02466 family)
MILKFFPKTIYLEDNLLSNFEENRGVIKKKIADAARVWGMSSSETLNAPSLHTTNPRLHKYAEFKGLSDAIIYHANRYVDELGYKCKLEIQTMWANVSEEGHYIYPHTHPGSLISGAYYLSAPEGSKITFESGDKFFFVPTVSTELTCNETSLECKPNRLLLFRSDLSHYTTKQLPGVKMVISFNLNPVQK